MGRRTRRTPDAELALEPYRRTVDALVGCVLAPDARDARCHRRALRRRLALDLGRATASADVPAGRVLRAIDRLAQRELAADRPEEWLPGLLLIRGLLDDEIVVDPVLPAYLDRSTDGTAARPDGDLVTGRAAPPTRAVAP
jgi:hypothetical protein